MWYNFFFQKFELLLLLGDTACDKSFDFSQHISYLCTKCDKTYSMKSDLIKHKNMHIGEEETCTCGICSYECNTLNQIIHHQNAHNSENAFICTKCDYR